MTMIPRRRRLSLPAGSTAYLLEELGELSRSCRRGWRRRPSLTAITFRPSKKGRDGIPDHPIPLEAFKLLAIRQGWRAGGRGMRPWTTLGIYRAKFDALAAVPIRFRVEEVHDLIRPGLLMGPRPNATAIRSALLLHQALEDGDRDDFVSVLEWPRFFYGFEAGREPKFPGAAEAGARATERSIEGLRTWPAELFAGPGAEFLRAFPPQRVFASLAHLKGRQVRNPAFALLKRHGLLPRFADYRSWLRTVSDRRDGVRLFQDPGLERTEAGRLRGLIESHVLADRGREGRMLDELALACEAMGLRVPEELERLDWLAGLLDNPWSPAEVPYAARVQIVEQPDLSSRAMGDDVSRLELEEGSTVARRLPEREARSSPSRSNRS